MPSTDAIFLLGADGELERVPYGTYANEAMLQELIANYPELLAGDQINREDPPRWLLVTREAGVPDAADSSDRWSLDHLLLDHCAIPILVEVKRSSDTRIRREVVGQMLDYAANASLHWPTDHIRSLAVTQYGGVEELDRRVEELLDPAPCQEGSVDSEGYWKAVDDNLRSGKLRLLFVADELPRELRRLIEFLNEHMPKIEVLGVEVRHYAGKSLRALVPRVIGQTERARGPRPPGASRIKTTEADFLQKCPPWTAAFFKEEVVDPARAKGLVISWAKGFGIRATIKPVSILWGYPPGTMRIEEPFISIWLKELEEYGLATALRQNLLGVGGFRESGKYTLILPLTEANLPQARAALQYVWEAYQEINEADFLQLCPPWTHSLFQEDVLGTAQAKGLTVSWKPERFSIHATGPCPILQIYPPGYQGIDAPALQIVLEDIQDSRAADELRTELVALGGFSESEQDTIFLALTEANLPQARAALQYLGDTYDQCQGGGPTAVGAERRSPSPLAAPERSTGSFGRTSASAPATESEPLQNVRIPHRDVNA